MLGWQSTTSSRATGPLPAVALRISEAESICAVVAVGEMAKV